MSVQIKVWAEEKIVKAFKAACIQGGVTMSGEITKYMSKSTNELEETNTKIQKKTQSRGNRRKEINNVIKRLEQIRDAEEQYKENIPENLKSGEAYEAAESAVDIIDQAIELLSEAF